MPQKKSISIKFPPGKVNVLRGSEEIAIYIKEDKNAILGLVQREGLPAWKRNRAGPWRAITVDLDNWLIGQRNKFIGKRIEDAIDDDGLDGL